MTLSNPRSTIAAVRSIELLASGGDADLTISELSKQHWTPTTMSETIKPPTRQEFVTTVRDAFAFLRKFGFGEVSPPSHRAKEHFQVWFRADQRFVIVKGEGYGTMASVMLEHEDGLELPAIDLVPPEDRPGTKGKRRKVQPGQLEQVREAARRLEQHGADFLRGDASRFLASARPLPPYKRSST
jgi:hypothetical protein